MRRFGGFRLDAFDYAWFINVPPHDPKLTKGMTPVWQGSGSVLYRLDK